MQVVLVEWMDSVTHDNWAPVEEVEHSILKPCRAAGFLVTKNKDKVTIALLASCQGDAYASWVNIPTENVIRIEELKTVEI
jgi:hypothetical protein